MILSIKLWKRRPGTPIQAAAEVGKLVLVKELHRRGAIINADAGPKLGRTDLQAACNAERERANMDLVEYLLDNGADINAKTGVDGGLTAIQGAAIQGNIQLVTLLMDRKADLNADPAIENVGRCLDQPVLCPASSTGTHR
jgi:ankyrin repeat protein